MKTSWRRMAVGAAAMLLLATSCGGPEMRSNEGTLDTRQEMRDPYARYYQSQPQRPFEESIPRVLDTKNGNAVIHLISNGNEYYVPMQEFSQLLGFNSKWDEQGQTYSIGDNDPVFELRMNSTQAVKEEQQVSLPSPPVVLNGAVHLALSAFSTMFQEEADFIVSGSELLLRPSFLEQVPPLDAPDDATDESGNFGGGTGELDFADDPEDPLRDVEVWLPDMKASIPTQKNIDEAALLREAKRYLGVPYRFGADPYHVSKRFDCSTYTQHLFGKRGINLRRTARAQAKQGIQVSRKSLRKGDLLFFYVPGRFKKEKTIGHVGIYMGNQQMIHSSPEPKNGVQITSINKAYWKSTFVKAKRVSK